MKTKKLITLVLCTIFIVGMLPFSAVAADVSRGEGLSSGDIARPFSYYFPDQGFARAVADGLSMNVNDSVTEEELATVPNIYSYSDSISNIEGIRYLTNLEFLSIYYSHIKEISYEVAQLSNLSSLVIYGCQIKEIPEFIGDLPNLQSLGLDQNQIKEIPEFIGDLSNLEYLTLQGNQIKEIPEFIGNLTNLTRLDLGYNKINGVPNYIGNLINLEYLVLDNAQIKEIPEFIENLSNLQFLSLADNQIKEIPSFIVNLTKLRTLALSGNQIKTIPGYLNKLSSLECIYAPFNRIEEISDDLDLSRISSVMLHNQNATLDKKIFQYGHGITANELKPQFINLMLKYYNISNDGWYSDRFSWSILNDETKEKIIIDYDRDDILLEKGEYTVILETNYIDYYDYLSNHKFTIPIEIVDSAPEPTPPPTTYTHTISGSAKTDKGSYDVTVQGLFEGELEEGRNVLTASELANIQLRGVANHIDSNEILAFNQNKITGATVTVNNGEITDFIIYGNVKTASGKKENFTIKSGTNSNTGTVWSAKGQSSKGMYDLNLGGDIPTGLTEGRNIFDVSEIANMNIRGLYINNQTGESKFINQNQITSMDIRVSGGKITKITVTGSAKTPNGVKDTFEITVNY